VLIIFLSFLNSSFSTTLLHAFPTRRSSDLSCHSFHADYGISDSNELQARVKKKMIERAEKSYIMVDHTKIGRKSFSYIDNVVHRSEEHTSELQSRFDLVCRLLLEKKKNKNK